tara:strand:- start:38 stop:232 length:195 start_codon:yes stop_codon:yes gene_type:complete
VVEVVEAMTIQDQHQLEELEEVVLVVQDQAQLKLEVVQIILVVEVVVLEFQVQVVLEQVVQESL